MKTNTTLRIAALVLSAAMVLSACSNAESLKKKGDASLASGDPAKALGFYDKALKKQPSPQLYISRSKAYLQQANTEAALEALNAALDLDAELLDAYLARAAVYFRINNLEAARSDYEAALSIDSGNQDAQKGVAAIDNRETQALRNTTWWFEEQTSATGRAQMVLDFGTNTVKYVGNMIGIYYGPAYGPLYNGARILQGTVTLFEWPFEVKGSQLLLEGDFNGKAEIDGDTIRMVSANGTIWNFKKGKPPAWVGSFSIE